MGPSATVCFGAAWVEFAYSDHVSVSSDREPVTEPTTSPPAASPWTPAVPIPGGVVALSYVLIAVAWFPLVGSVLHWMNCRVPADVDDLRPLYSASMTAIVVLCWFWVQRRSTMLETTRVRSFVILAASILAVGLVPIVLVVVSPLTPYIETARRECGSADDGLVGLVLYLPLLSFLVAQLINPAGSKASLTRWIITAAVLTGLWAAYALIVQPWPPAGS